MVGLRHLRLCHRLHNPGNVLKCQLPISAQVETVIMYPKRLATRAPVSLGEPLKAILSQKIS